MAELVLQHIVHNELWYVIGLEGLVTMPGVAKYWMPVINSPVYNGYISPSSDNVSSLMGHYPVKTIEVTQTLTATKTERLSTTTTATAWSTSTDFSTFMDTTTATLWVNNTVTDTSIATVTDWTTSTETNHHTHTTTLPPRIATTTSFDTIEIKKILTSTTTETATRTKFIDPFKKEILPTYWPQEMPSWFSTGVITWSILSSLAAFFAFLKLNHLKSSPWHEKYKNLRKEADARVKDLEAQLAASADTLVESEHRNDLFLNKNRDQETGLQNQLNNLVNILGRVFGQVIDPAILDVEIDAPEMKELERALMGVKEDNDSEKVHDISKQNDDSAKVNADLMARNRELRELLTKEVESDDRAEDFLKLYDRETEERARREEVIKEKNGIIKERDKAIKERDVEIMTKKAEIKKLKRGGKK